MVVSVCSPGNHHFLSFSPPSLVVSVCFPGNHHFLPRSHPHHWWSVSVPLVTTISCLFLTPITGGQCLFPWFPCSPGGQRPWTSGRLSSVTTAFLPQGSVTPQWSFPGMTHGAKYWRNEITREALQTGELPPSPEGGGGRGGGQSTAFQRKSLGSGMVLGEGMEVVPV